MESGIAPCYLRRVGRGFFLVLALYRPHAPMSTASQASASTRPSILQSNTQQRPKTGAPKRASFDGFRGARARRDTEVPVKKKYAPSVSLLFWSFCLVLDEVAWVRGLRSAGLERTSLVRRFIRPLLRCLHRRTIASYKEMLEICAMPCWLWFSRVCAGLPRESGQDNGSNDGKRGQQKQYALRWPA